VSTPAAPVLVGSVGTGSYPMYAAVAGRYVYVVNDGANTLQIFDLGGAYVQQLEAGAMETGTLQTRDTVTMGNNLDVRGGLTVSASARIAGGLGVSGNVGIGLTNAPSYTLQVIGSVAGVGAYVNLSDARYKKNITPLEHGLDKIMALRGVEYDWRREEYPQMRFDAGKQVGFVAQELKGVLPEAVTQDAEGYYSIAYSKVIPVLVEAVKDQQKAITNKDAEIQDLKARLEKVEQSLGTKNGGGKLEVRSPKSEVRRKSEGRTRKTGHGESAASWNAARQRRCSKRNCRSALQDAGALKRRPRDSARFWSPPTGSQFYRLFHQ
jgi:ElaB/YqjD/DUF883 family membrane-anchored ribosome-binding protein